MANKRIIFFSDNAAVVDIVNKQTSTHKDIMVLLRDLVLRDLASGTISLFKRVMSPDYKIQEQITFPVLK